VVVTEEPQQIGSLWELPTAVVAVVGLERDNSILTLQTEERDKVAEAMAVSVNKTTVNSPIPEPQIVVVAVGGVHGSQAIRRVVQVVLAWLSFVMQEIKLLLEEQLVPLGGTLTIHLLVRGRLQHESLC
jgi:hypothetical protein|tara:strand:- start:123 stop:509 length:387 start_codon:yes stop_codon:yes gene_type:complete